LKLDLKSETGAMVYEKLASLPQEHLNKINAQNFSDLSKANFVEIAQRLEANGIDIRSRQEHQIENNSPRMKAEQERRELRESASQNIALAYDNAINIIKQYQGNQGWINVGFYREKLGKLLSNVNPTKINTCFDDVIKELEKEKKFAVGYLKGKSTNDKEFKEAFKKVSGGVEYNEANMKAFLDVAQDQSANFEDEKYNEKFWNAYNKAFGVAKTDKNGKVYYEPQVVKQATSRTNFQQYVDGAGDIVLMLLGTEAIGKGVAWAGGKLISKVSPYVPKFLANAGSKTVMTIGSNNITVGRVAANMASQSASFTLWDASKNYINLKTKDIQYSGKDAEKEWEAYKEGNVESAKFGAFAGALNTTVVGKVINGTMKMFEKPIAKAISKVGKSFEKTSAMSGSDVMKTFMLNQTPGALAKTAGTIAEIGGFTLYETANEVIEELLKKGEGGHLPAKLTEDGLTSYLLDKLGDQAKNLGEIKAISRLIFMHKGAIQEQARLMDENLAKCETLKNVQIKKTEVNGREIFEVTLPDGSRKVANSVEEVIANCNVLMQLDIISNAAKENETTDKKTTPQGMNAEEDALIQKARKENPATVVEEKVRRQWQQSDLETPAPDEKVDLFNLDPNAGLKEPVQNVENEVTSLIFKGKLNETLTQRYDEMGRVFTEITQRRSADIEALAKQNPKNKQAVADGIAKILAQELGMEGFEPPIVFENTNGGDGFADWPNGRIVVNKDITNVKKLTSMISHEFVHMLQYRDILAQYGEQGLRDLIANDKSIPENEKESHIQKALNNPYNQHLLQSYDFQKAQTGTVNDYLRRIYKDEFTNTVGTDNMPEYVNQATERGAYSSQEKVDRGLDESNLGELSVGEYVPNDASLAALRAKMKAKLQAGQDVTSNNPLNRTSEHTEAFEINSNGEIVRKGVPAGIPNENKQEILNIFDSKKGLKDIKDEVKNEIAKLVGNSLPENQDQMIKLIYKLKNAKEWWGEKTQEYNDEQLLQIIKTASNPDDSLNLIVLQRICKRMDGGPRDDNSNITRILPRDTKELNLARRSDGFFDEDLVLIGKKLTYAHETREEIFKLLKDENGNPVKDLVELVLTDKSESFDEGDMILNVLKSLYTDGKLDINKVGQMKELVKDGSGSIYRAAHTMQSGMPADIMKNIGIFSQKGLTSSDISTVINYLKNNNIEPTFESVKNILENCGNIPELRDIQVKQLLNQRGESIDKSYYEYVKKMAQDIEQTIKTHPEMAELGLYPKDIIGNYIKLLHIEGRSTQLKQHEILELLDVRNRGPFSINSDKLIESGLLKDIPNREKPLDKREISQLLKEDTETLKQIVDKNLLSDSFKALRNLKYGSSGVIISGGKSTLKMLSELPIEELNNYRMALDLDAAIKLVKTNPQKAQEIVKSMREFGYKDAEIVLDFIKDHNVELAEVLLNDNRFTKNTILKILPKSSSEIAQARLDFYNDYKNDGILRENGALIYLMNNVIPENRALLDKIHSQGLFNNQDALLVAHWFNCTNKYNTRLVEKLYADNSYNFKSISEYSDIFSSIRNEQSAILFEKIYNNKEFSSLIDKNVLSNILYNVNETNIKFAEMLCFDKELYTDNKIDNKKMTIISDIFGNTNNGNIRLAERLYTDKELNFPKDKIPKILSNTHIDNVDFVEKICTNEELNLTMDDILHIINSEYSPSSSKYLAEKNIKQILDSVEMQRYKVLESPDLYVNGEYNNETEIKNAVEKFFNNNKTGLMVVSSLYDKEAFNNLLRMRFDDVKEYLEEINKFSKEELELVENLSKSCNVNGKPFMPSQKIEFMDLIKAYKDNKLSLEKMHSMIESGKVDIGQLNIDLFNTIMKNSGLTEEEIVSIQKEKLIAWDTKYAHLLSKEINSEKDVAFSDLLRAGNLEPDFTQYIHNTNNIYGQTNVKTRNLYGELGMNYDKWLKPSKENEVHFVSKDRNTEQLSQIANLITEDINTLMQTPVKGFLRKQFPKFIKGDDFVIPNEYLTSKVKLTELVNLLADTSDKGQLAQVWKRAQGNSTNPDPNRATTARNTLTILDHLNQRLDDISKIQDTKASKTLDLTIKMWDRNPQKDIFQGNYSTCCIGMGGGNGSAMPHFVMDTAYNMIELVDNKTGKTIGNALCYFIKGANGKPAFIIDNIEINNGVKPSEEVGLQLRNSMVEYAARVSKEVTGLDDVSIYMSGSYNDVPCKDLKQEEQSISFLGDIDCEDIYMDLYGGWIEKENLNTKLHLLKLK